MTFYKRIPERYFWLIPALYFAGLGAYDIGSELLDKRLTAYNAIFNAAFFLPLIFRHRYVFLIIGIAASFLFGYIFIVELVWFIQFLTGTHFKDPLDTFAFGIPWTCFSLLCAISLIYIGITRSQTTKTIQSTI